MLVAGNAKGQGTLPHGNAMGRRSTHTPQQLRELILDAAQDIIQDQGLAGLSAREVARRIEYSPGTIYNMFENLDDVVLHVEARVLDALDRRLGSVLTDTGNPTDRIGRLAQAYLAFTHEKPRLWNLLFEHHMPADAQLPSWYQQKLEGLMGRVEEAMAPLFPPGRERRSPARRARAVGGRTRHHLAVDRGQAVGGDDGDREPPGRGPGWYLPRGPRRRRQRAGGQGGLTGLAPRLPYRGTYRSSRDRMCFWTVVACGVPG